MLELKYWCMKAVCSPQANTEPLLPFRRHSEKCYRTLPSDKVTYVLCPHDMNPRFPDTDKQIHFDFSCRVVTDVGRNILGIKRLWDKHIYIELGKRA